MRDGWTVTRQQVTWDDLPADLRETDPDLIAGDAWVLRQYGHVVDVRRCLMRRTVRVRPGSPESAQVYQWLHHGHELDLDPNAFDWFDYELHAEALTARAMLSQPEELPLFTNERSAAA